MRYQQPAWEPERTRAYTEAALVACARSQQEPLTRGSVLLDLSSDVLRWIRQLPADQGATPEDTFWQSLVHDEVLAYDEENQRYLLGALGSILVTSYLEGQMLDE